MEKGHKAMARPSTGVAGHSQAPFRGGSPRPSHLQGGGWLWPRPRTKGRQLSVGMATCSVAPEGVANPQGAVTNGQPTRGCRLWPGWLPADKGSCRLCRGDDGGSVRVREEGRASF
ncbi:hypothetical protein BHE74_00046801 [Ensete ventricosum]|nr:hypothetical protein GW17_00050385 [Ensete ventricosum]RWW47224.1 hypothetical protein BHE74_00046801 [Ensete ventricosum]RZS24968.1 hypothetical protein BHM03_00058110 [Ensete ventricosum]